MHDAAEKVVLGFDFGMKRIGVAIGHTLTLQARPLVTLQARDGIPDWNSVKKLIDDWRPSLLLVGVPLQMNGTEQEITRLARKFAQRLKDLTGLPTLGIDERLSTIEARAVVFEQGGYKKLKKTEIDPIAAQLLVEQWLRDQKIGDVI